MYGKRFVTGDRQKACLFEQKGSYMASIKDSSGSLSAICDDYGMDYAVLNYGINDVGIQDLKESGFKTVYSDDLTVCLKRNTV